MAACGLLYNDSYSNYNSLLLNATRPTTEMSRLQRLAIKFFKTLDEVFKTKFLKFLNPDFMHTLFQESL